MLKNCRSHVALGRVNDNNIQLQKGACNVAELFNGGGHRETQSSYNYKKRRADLGKA